MGQPIVVVEKPSVANPGVVRFETNRAISGMGHERYRAGDEVRGDRPPDELARRLFDRGGIAAVHVNGSVVTVDLEKGRDAAGIGEIIERLYIHYPDVEPEAEAEVADVEPEVADAEAEVVADDAPAAEEAPAAEPAAEAAPAEEPAAEEPVTEPEPDEA